MAHLTLDIDPSGVVPGSFLSIFHAMVSIDGTGADDIEFVCYSGNVGPVPFGGFSFGTFDLTHRIYIHPAVGHEHNGIPGDRGCAYAATAEWCASDANDQGLTPGDFTLCWEDIPPYIKIERMLVFCDDPGGDCIGQIAGADSNGIIIDGVMTESRVSSDVGPTHIGLSHPTVAMTATPEIRNCIAVDLSTGTSTVEGNAIQFTTGSANCSINIYNNTAYNKNGKMGNGVELISGGAGNVALNLKNNIMLGCPTADYSKVENSTGVFTITAANNISGDATADDFGGAANVTGRQAALVFADAASDDLRPLTNGDADRTGATLASVTADALGVARSAPYSIGAFQDPVAEPVLFQKLGRITFEEDTADTILPESMRDSDLIIDL